MPLKRHTQKNAHLDTNLVNRKKKINHLMYMGRHQTGCKKMKKNWKTNTRSEKYIVWDIGMEFSIEKMCHACNEKVAKRDLTDGMETAKIKDKIRTFREKETYKFLEVDTIKTNSNERKKLRIISQEKPEKTTRNKNYVAENLIKGIKYLGLILVRYSGLFLKLAWEELK